MLPIRLLTGVSKIFTDLTAMRFPHFVALVATFLSLSSPRFQILSPSNCEARCVDSCSSAEALKI